LLGHLRPLLGWMLRPFPCNKFVISTGEVMGLRPTQGNESPTDSVPQGRLSLAQDASPGFDSKRVLGVPQGRLTVTHGCIRGYFQPSLRDWILPKIYPGLASRAKLNRPCGTESGYGGLTRTLYVLEGNVFRPKRSVVERSAVSGFSPKL
jgi:hypothetical protein